MKKVLEVIELTKEEVLTHEKGDYNRTEWKRIVARYEKYEGVKFYERVNSPNDYEEIFAVYTLDEGLTLINSVSFSACVHNGGFSKIYILPAVTDSSVDAQPMMYKGKLVRDVYSSLFTKIGESGETVSYRAGNTNSNRRALVSMSKQVGGLIFSNDY